MYHYLSWNLQHIFKLFLPNGHLWKWTRDSKDDFDTYKYGSFHNDTWYAHQYFQGDFR